ncbi:MAG: CofH family radical SAM protein, partial [Bacillota bacterium]
LCREIRRRAPGIHIHAFSPFEVWYGARQKGWTVADYLVALKEAGLDSMPGTAAEILDDEVRRQICPTKLNVAQWVSVVEAAHRVGIPTSATMMYGHVESNKHRARHVALIRSMQKSTGGFTEFVPLSFVHPRTALFRSGHCRPGATGLEDVKVHAVARLMLRGAIRNVQVSWVKLGPKLAQVCLAAGANDLGGTLIEEHISRSAGSAWGASMAEGELRWLAESIGRVPRRRSTTYQMPN